jgi:hypothetical protein
MEEALPNPVLCEDKCFGTQKAAGSLRDTLSVKLTSSEV